MFYPGGGYPGLYFPFVGGIEAGQVVDAFAVGVQSVDAFARLVTEVDAVAVGVQEVDAVQPYDDV